MTLRQKLIQAGRGIWVRVERPAQWDEALALEKAGVIELDYCCRKWLARVPPGDEQPPEHPTRWWQELALELYNELRGTRMDDTWGVVCFRRAEAALKEAGLIKEKG